MLQSVLIARDRFLNMENPDALIIPRICRIHLAAYNDDANEALQEKFKFIDEKKNEVEDNFCNALMLEKYLLSPSVEIFKIDLKTKISFDNKFTYQG